VSRIPVYALIFLLGAGLIFSSVFAQVLTPAESRDQDAAAFVPVDFHGFTHNPLGAGILTLEGSSLSISNLGSEGIDGFDLDLGPCKCDSAVTEAIYSTWEMDLDSLNDGVDPPLGAWLTIDASTALETGALLPVNSLVMERTVGGYEFTPSFSSPNYAILVYDDNGLTHVVRDHTGAALTSSVPFTSCEPLRITRARWNFQTCAVSFPSGTALQIDGGSAVVGNRVEFIAAATLPDHFAVSKIEVRAKDISRFKISSEYGISSAASVGELHDAVMDDFYANFPFESEGTRLTQADIALKLDLQRQYTLGMGADPVRAQNGADALLQTLDDLGFFYEDSGTTYFGSANTSDELVSYFAGVAYDNLGITAALRDSFASVWEMAERGDSEALITAHITTTLPALSWDILDRYAVGISTDIYESGLVAARATTDPDVTTKIVDYVTGGVAGFMVAPAGPVASFFAAVLWGELCSAAYAWGENSPIVLPGESAIDDWVSYAPDSNAAVDLRAGRVLYFPLVDDAELNVSWGAPDVGSCPGCPVQYNAHWERLDPGETTTGARLTHRAFGAGDGVPVQEIGWVQYEKTGLGNWDFSADFSALGSTTFTVQYMLSGFVVLEKTGQSGSYATGPVLTTNWHLGDPDAAGGFWCTFDQPWPLMPTASPQVVADAIMLIPESPLVDLDYMVSSSFSTRGIDRLAFDLSETIAPTPTTAPTPTRPSMLALQQNIPNPFNPRTEIRYELPTAGLVSLVIHDTRGRLVKSLVQREEAAGQHSVIWNGDDSRGVRVSSGMYFYTIKAAGETHTRRMALVR